jgi:Formin Homology 2 Domain
VQAKAFDKKTSVLHYVVKLVKKNDDALLSFENDIVHVIPAENVLLDSLVGEVKAISEELDSVLEIVQEEAEKLEEAGALQKMSLSDLAEQRTMVHHIGSVPQFNKISHLTGRTSMERFTLNAKVACDQAAESIDNVKKKYAMVLGYFGEDENMATSDFFGILRRFITEWNKATDQVEKIEKAEVSVHQCKLGVNLARLSQDLILLTRNRRKRGNEQQIRQQKTRRRRNAKGQLQLPVKAGASAGSQQRQRWQRN